MNRKALARKIAADIFSCALCPASEQVRRIQFKGNGESDLGGLCWQSLVRVIYDSLEKHRKQSIAAKESK